MATEHWAHFPHEADMGVRGIGSTLEQAFEQAALVMTAVVTDPATVILEMSSRCWWTGSMH